MAKYRKAPEGTVANVGDKVLNENGLGRSTYVIHRVTSKRAYVRWNELAEGCFGRVVDSWGQLRPIPREHTWSSTSYYYLLLELEQEQE